MELFNYKISCFYLIHNSEVYSVYTPRILYFLQSQKFYLASEVVPVIVCMVGDSTLQNFFIIIIKHKT
jgi:hypothetical protein